MKLTKYENNPILSANPENDWESLCVLNPAVWYEPAEDTFYMLYRAAGNDATHYIHLGLATSKDGFHFERRSDQPFLSPDINGPDGGCIEDPRLTKMGDTYYIVYAARTYAPGQYWSADWKPLGDRDVEGVHFVQANNAVSHLAVTKDFRTVKRLGRISDSRFDDRDVILFPERVNGQYVRLSRPVERVGQEYGCTVPSIFISFSDDLMEWGEPQLLMTAEEWWQDKKMGGSCPPIKTPKGWLHLFHGVASRDDGYRVGAALLDLDNPAKVIGRTADFIMEPEFDYETSGYYNGCVFPTGNAVKGDTLYVYYGAADKFVCAATCRLSELLDFIVSNTRRGDR
ncbi:MAG TPA: glycosidase [Firmicutes bacterium]|nr:glycosidase [Bacillota bacterium]